MWLRVAVLVVVCTAAVVAARETNEQSDAWSSSASDNGAYPTSLLEREKRKQSPVSNRVQSQNSERTRSESHSKPAVSNERRDSQSSHVPSSRGGAAKSRPSSTIAAAEQGNTAEDTYSDSQSASDSKSRINTPASVSEDNSESVSSARTCDIREQPGVIVDVQQSFKIGAQALHKTNTTYDDCVSQCCATKRCNTVVFGSGQSTPNVPNSRRAQKRSSTCYLFDCGSTMEKCLMSAHPQFTTVQLAAGFGALGEKCDGRDSLCRDMHAICSANGMCECAHNYVMQYAACVPLRCGPDEFQCWTLPNATASQAPPVCIASYNRCDARHIAQCPDGSDEFDCPEEPETYANGQKSDSSASNPGKPSKGNDESRENRQRVQQQPETRVSDVRKVQKSSADSDSSRNDASYDSRMKTTAKPKVKPAAVYSGTRPSRTRAKVKSGDDENFSATDYGSERSNELRESEQERETESEDQSAAAVKNKSKGKEVVSGKSKAKVKQTEQQESVDKSETSEADGAGSRRQKLVQSDRQTGRRPAASSNKQRDQEDYESESEKETETEDDTQSASEGESGKSRSRSKSATKAKVNSHVNVNISVGGSQSAKGRSRESEPVRASGKAVRWRPASGKAKDELEEEDGPEAETETETESESEGTMQQSSTARPQARKNKPSGSASRNSQSEESERSGDYDDLDRVLGKWKDRQRTYKSTRRPSIALLTTAAARGHDTDTDTDSDTDFESESGSKGKWRPSGRHVTTRRPLFDWYELPMPEDEEDEERDADQDCVTDYEAFTEAGAGRYNRRNRTLCRPYAYSYDSGRSQNKDKSSNDRERQKSTTLNRDRDRQKSPKNSKSQFADSYYDNEGEIEPVEDYDYDEAPHYYDDAMGNSQAVPQSQRARERSRSREKDREKERQRSRDRTNDYNFNYKPNRFSNTNRMQDDEEYDATIERQRSRISSALLMHRSTGKPSERKSTTRGGSSQSQSQSQSQAQSQKPAEKIDSPPAQPFEAVFGANMTQIWNVHAILSGLFDHRATQLDDSSVSEQNALIVAIVLLVGGLLMTSVLIALVACNLRRLLGLSKRRYARRSANGDTERLVNGLNL